MAGAGFVYLWWLHVWFHKGDSIPIKRVRRVSNRVGRSCVIFRSPVVKIASPSNIQTQFLSHDLTTIILTFHFRSKFIEQYIFNILLHTISGGGLNYFAPLSPRESMIVHQQKDWIVKTCWTTFDEITHKNPQLTPRSPTVLYHRTSAHQSVYAPAWVNPRRPRWSLTEFRDRIPW